MPPRNRVANLMRQKGLCYLKQVRDRPESPISLPRGSLTTGHCGSVAPTQHNAN